MRASVSACVRVCVCVCVTPHGHRGETQAVSGLHVAKDNSQYYWYAHTIDNSSLSLPPPLATSRQLYFMARKVAIVQCMSL